MVAAPPPLSTWYEQNPEYVSDLKKQMQIKAHYVIDPKFFWTSIAHLARTQSDQLLNVLQAGFKHIETESFQSTFSGLFSEINLASEKLGKTYMDRNAQLCAQSSQKSPRALKNSRPRAIPSAMPTNT